MTKSIALLGIFVALLLSACEEEIMYIPKPRVYPKVEYPARNYVKMDKNYCTFSFQYPDYMEFVQDTAFGNKGTLHPCWFNLKIPNFNGDIHFTYTDISKGSVETNLHKIYNDAYGMAREHDRKATSNEDLIIHRPNHRVYGVLFNIEGDAASSFQFILTDSTQHAIRASLYFKNRPKADSMAPIIEFVKVDMMNMLNSFEWKK